ncbi:hypothetical protein RB213_015923 [Colletotrichum asianum]
MGILSHTTVTYNHSTEGHHSHPLTFWATSLRVLEVLNSVAAGNFQGLALLNCRIRETLLEGNSQHRKGKELSRNHSLAQVHLVLFPLNLEFEGHYKSPPRGREQPATWRKESHMLQFHGLDTQLF